MLFGKRGLRSGGARPSTPKVIARAACVRFPANG